MRGKESFLRLKKKSWTNLTLCNDAVRKDFCDSIHLPHAFLGCKTGSASNSSESDRSFSLCWVRNCSLFLAHFELAHYLGVTPLLIVVDCVCTISVKRPLLKRAKSIFYLAKGSKWLPCCGQNVEIAYTTLVTQIKLLAFATLAGAAPRYCHVVIQKSTKIKAKANHSSQKFSFGR